MKAVKNEVYQLTMRESSSLKMGLVKSVLSTNTENQTLIVIRFPFCRQLPSEQMVVRADQVFLHMLPHSAADAYLHVHLQQL